MTRPLGRDAWIRRPRDTGERSTNDLIKDLQQSGAGSFQNRSIRTQHIRRGHVTKPRLSQTAGNTVVTGGAGDTVIETVEEIPVHRHCLLNAGMVIDNNGGSLATVSAKIKGDGSTLRTVTLEVPAASERSLAFPWLHEAVREKVEYTLEVASDFTVTLRTTTLIATALHV